MKINLESALEHGKYHILTDTCIRHELGMALVHRRSLGLTISEVITSVTFMWRFSHRRPDLPTSLDTRQDETCYSCTPVSFLMTTGGICFHYHKVGKLKSTFWKLCGSSTSLAEFLWFTHTWNSLHHYKDSGTYGTYRNMHSVTGLIVGNP